MCYYYFSGKAPPTGELIMMRDGRNLVDVNMTLISLIAWSIILMALNVFLLRKMRGVSIEEIRAA
jgi:hypothetical protein